MNADRIIAIAAIVVPAIFSTITTWVLFADRRKRNQPAAKPASQALASASSKPHRPRFLTKGRIVTFLVNWAAALSLLHEVEKEGEVTRYSVLIIAAAVGVMIVCFLLPLVSGVYEYVDASHRD
jgi:hypothetical protein